MRILVGVLLLPALVFATGCSSSEESPPTLEEAALEASGEAQSIIDGVVGATQAQMLYQSALLGHRGDVLREVSARSGAGS